MSPFPNSSKKAPINITHKVMDGNSSEESDLDKELEEELEELNDYSDESDDDLKKGK
jgi:hypothetical protein